MAHQLGFQRYPYISTAASFQQINLLTWANISVQRYTPATPSMRNGVYGNVTETIEVMFKSSTAATTEVQAALNRIEQWLQAAKLRADTGAGDRVFVYLWMDGEAMAWRSEILDGVVTLADGSLQTWGQAKLEARITFTRRYFWEGTEQEIALTSQTQTALAVGGRTIQNRKDATGGNWVDIQPGRVLGVLPTPAKISLTNNTSLPESHQTIYMATTGPVTTPATVNYVLEAENAVGGGGTVHGATASNGSRLDLDFTGKELITKQWLIGIETVARIAGRPVRIILRTLFGTGGPVFVKASLRAADGVSAVAPACEEVRISSAPATLDIYDLGTVRFPQTGSPSPTGLRLQLEFRSAASALLELDYIMLLIGDGTGFRTLYNLNQTLAANATLVDDGPRETAYMLVNGLEDPSVQTYGPPLWLYPSEARTQRLYFLINQGFAAPVNKQVSVSIRHRPRRLTV